MTIKQIAVTTYGPDGKPMDVVTIELRSLVVAKFDGVVTELSMAKEQAYLLWKDLIEIFGTDGQKAHLRSPVESVLPPGYDEEHERQVFNAKHGMES
jgi:hypothetical protein